MEVLATLLGDNGDIVGWLFPFSRLGTWVSANNITPAVLQDDAFKSYWQPTFKRGSTIIVISLLIKHSDLNCQQFSPLYYSV